MFTFIFSGSRPNFNTLIKWGDVVAATADFMASFAFYNSTTGVYDLGPPMYVQRLLKKKTEFVRCFQYLFKL